MKKALLPLVLAFGFAGSGCLGPDNLYHSVKNWNAEISEEDWVVELVFLGLIIVPVYPLALAGDVLVFNTIQYWSDDQVIKDPGEFPGFVKD